MEIRLVGENISPDNITASELAEVLVNLEKAIVEIAQSKGDKEVEASISLVSIENKCAKLGLYPHSTYAAEAFYDFTLAVKDGNYADLPRSSIDPIRNLVKFSQKKGCEIELRNQPDSEKPDAKITPATEIVIPDLYVASNTVIYGIVERVGGATRPRVSIKVSGEKLIHCDVSKDMAKELGKRLYSWVGLLGKARWDIEDHSIVSFEILDITEYEDTSASEAMSGLAELCGRYYEDITDVEEYVSQIRGE